MWRKKALTYSSILLIYLVIITVLRWQFSWRWLFFWLGGFAGLALFNLDHAVYLLWQVPEDPNSAELKRLLKEKKPVPILDFLSQTADSRHRLVAHSVIFQLVLAVLGIFALTSTAGIFGKGMMIGLFLCPLISQGGRLLRGEDINAWFWQLDQVPELRHQAFYFLGMVMVLVVFSLLLV